MGRDISVQVGDGRVGSGEEEEGDLERGLWLEGLRKTLSRLGLKKT